MSAVGDQSSKRQTAPAARGTCDVARGRASVRGACVLSAALLVASPAGAESPPIGGAPKPPPFLYSVPWQLRPLPAPTVVRLDTMVGFDEDRASRRGATAVSFLTLAARIPRTGPPRAGLDLVARGGFVHDKPPTGNGGNALTNLLVGAAYAFRLPKDLLLNVFVGGLVPIGSGGGNSPDPDVVLARSRAAAVRSAFDNPTFASNDAGGTSGIGVGWVSRGWTLQLEGTIAHVVRVRGAQAQREATRTNSSFGVHVGYFLFPALSLNTELRYQRWVNPPFTVEGDPTKHTLDTVTYSVGPRFHIETAIGWLRPGVAYARALDKPLAAAAPNLHVIQVDVPFFF